jgi:1,2-diacylglycerol 3-alpha-glucosyltransferase
MRIAYFSDNFFPEISGISDSIITTGEMLRKKGHEVVYIAPWYHEDAHGLAKKKGDHAASYALPVKRLPSLPMHNSPTGQSRIAIPCGASLPFLMRFKPDVIHTQSPFGAGLEALLASRILGVPLVGTNHTPIEEFVHYSPIFGNRLSLFARKYFSWYYNRCLFVTAPFPGLIERMQEVGLKAKAEARANPVSFEVFRAVTPDERRKAKAEMRREGPMVLYSGRLAPEKRVDVLIEAFAKIANDLPSAALYVTGHGAQAKELEALAARKGIATRVHFTGFVDNAKLAQLYRAADVFVIMSTAETQSLSLMQAFASSVPAIVANAGALPYYTPSQCGFVVEPGDTTALAAQLKELLSDEKLRLHMGTAAARYVAKFSPETIAGQWEDTFEKAHRN